MWFERNRDLVGLAVSFLGGVLVSAFWINRSTGELWTVVSAIGTVAAALAAVWIAIDQRLKDRRAREKRAVLLGAGLYGRIADLVHVSAKVNTFGTQLELNRKYEGWVSDLNDLAQEIDASSNISHEDVASLVDLPDNGAFRLAEALGAIHRLKVVLERAKWQIDIAGEDAPNDQMLAAILEPFAQRAWVGLTRVQQIIDSARPPDEPMPLL